jgi:hypothetical protein
MGKGYKTGKELCPHLVFTVAILEEFNKMAVVTGR